MKHIKNTFIASLFLIIALQSCQKAEQAGTQKSAPQIPLVNVQQTVKTKMVSYIEFTGTVQANIISDKKSPVDGVIESLSARENELVTKDRIIAIINPNDRLSLIASNQLEIQKLEQQLKNADANNIDTLQQELETAKSNLEYAKNMYQTVPVVCPMDGMVTYRWLDAGNQVGANEKIITISDMNSLVVKAEINEKYFGMVNQSKKLPVMLGAYPGDTLTGTISLVYPQIDPVTRSVKFDLKVQTNGKKLLPGMMATLRLPVSSNKNAITVHPNSILTSPDNSNFVFVADSDSVVHKRMVSIGISDEKRTEITTGLDEKESIVVMGQEMLKDNQKVKITGTPKKAVK
jgi:multidrug efflux pump subunit AcrA (membrane-fusion protein)